MEKSMSEVIDLKAEMLEEEENQKKQSPNSKLKISILGDTDLTIALKTLFNTNRTETSVFTSIDESIQWAPNITFICLPTKLLQNETLDDSDLINAIQKTIRQTSGGVCLKTIVSPDTIVRIQSSIDAESYDKRFVYSPEVYDSEDVGSIVNPKTILIGGSFASSSAVIDVYQNYSNLVMERNKVQVCTPVEAAFVKLAISGFTAVKQTFFNQLYDASSEYEDINFTNVRRIFASRDYSKEISITLPTFIRVKDQESLNNKVAKTHRGEYLNRDVKIFAALSDKTPLIDECVNYKNLKED